MTILGRNWGSFVRSMKLKTPPLETRCQNPSSLTSCSPVASVPLVNTPGRRRRSRPQVTRPLTFHSYLRPETAQGHFLNFNRLLEFNNGRIPFASAQIGRSFRNEISPRAGLLRVREFTMAEIEHYVDPEDKRHEHFREIRDVVLSLLDRDTQYAGSTITKKLSIGDAVDKGIVANETLGYFLVRIYEFLTKIGINPTRLRFRQHMGNEMAHYATDCWDAEIHNSYGWTECVGCADRAAYDLSVHSARTGQPLLVRQALKEPIITEKETPEFNKKVIGKTFGKDAAAVLKTVENLDEAGLLKLKGELAQG
jgi:glycyl-tRNA synthetase